MFLYVDIITPANTLITTPVITMLRTCPGMVRHVWVGFPHGCYGLCHVQIWDKGWQVWPWRPGASFHWENYIFDFEERYPLTAEPFQFKVKTWNLDDSYEHTPFFAVTIEPLPPPEEVGDLERVLRELGVMGV